MSRAKESLARVLDMVSYETEVPASAIMGGRSDTETVEARWICAKLLRERGYYCSRIAELMGITPRYVQYILTDFDDRAALCPAMRRNYEQSRKRLRNDGETIR